MTHQSSPPPDHGAVVELRQYRLHPGRRDELIDLFERHLVDGQEACGIRVLGYFADADDPDRFVWLRGFRDLPARAAALREFYGGPVWAAQRAAANATMIDSDDVLQLRPLEGNAGVPAQHAGLVVATVYLLAEPAAGFARFFEHELRPLMTATGAAPIARLVTEAAANNFPALPVREGEQAFVWLAAFTSGADYERHQASLAAAPAWNDRLQPALRARSRSAPQRLRLVPASRSPLGRGPVVADVHDFDFLAGRWHVDSHRLPTRGQACTEWDRFSGTSTIALHMNGVANVEEIHFAGQGWSGMTLRTFDIERRRWSIYWVDGRAGTLTPPVVGGFDGNRGTFVGEDEDLGRPVRVIFTWTKRGPDAARWEQAFSYDGGCSWETNWIMDFNRLS